MSVTLQAEQFVGLDIEITDEIKEAEKQSIKVLTMTEEEAIYTFQPLFRKLFNPLTNHIKKDLKIENEVRFSINVLTKVIKVAVICSFDDYKNHSDKIYMSLRGFEFDFLSHKLPDLYLAFNYNFSIIKFSEEKPIDEELLVQDFPFIVE